MIDRVIATPICAHPGCATCRAIVVGLIAQQLATVPEEERAGVAVEAMRVAKALTAAGHLASAATSATSAAEGPHRMTGPMPAPRLRVLEDAADARRLDCAHYSACLDRAIVEDWPGFKCGNGCYQPLDDEQRARDTIGLLMVARWIERIDDR